MEIALITYPGLEHVAAAEAYHITGAKTRAVSGLVFCSIKDMKDVARLIYRCQAVRHIVEYVTVYDLKTGHFNKTLQGRITGTFAVRCIKVTEVETRSQDIAAGIGAQIKGTVDLEHPEVTVVAVLAAESFIGIDLAGDLSKRQYRIFAHGPLKAPVAFGLLSFAQYNGKRTLLDPFCGDGLIAIEAAHIAANFPMQYFAKDGIKLPQKLLMKEDTTIKKKIAGKIHCIDASFANLKAAEKNAKIAGLHKMINFSRMELDWLDTKFDKQTVDCIVTMIPQPNKRVDEKQIAPLYREFFYQAEHVLKKKGCIVTELNPVFENIAANKGFVVDERLTVQQGGRTFVFGRLRKG